MDTKQQKKWSEEVVVGDLKIKNRIIFAALTRMRCDPATNTPNDTVIEYYTQRVGAGILLTEATAVSQRGITFYGSSALYNEQHVAAWKRVVDSVHSKGGVIFSQLLHAGRGTHPSATLGLEPHAPSPYNRREKMRGPDCEYPIPKEMTLEDIETAKKEYLNSFNMAKKAGFDGIEVHAAHGYLIDSFAKTSSNKRTDAYGGSVENRVKFCLEVIDLAISVWGPKRVGIKLSPVARVGDVIDDNPVETFTYMVKELDKRGIAFIEFRESNETTFISNHFNVHPKDQIADVCKTFRPHFKGVIVANNNFNAETGLQKLNEDNCDMVSFGRLYISNPDLAERIIAGHPLNTNWDMKTFYGYENGPKGYTDYKRYGEQ